ETPSSKPTPDKEQKSQGGSRPTPRKETKESKEPKSSKEPKESNKPGDKGPDLTPTKAEPPAPKKDKPPKAKDDLDSLLDSASSGSGGKPAKQEKEDLPDQLSMGDVQKILKGINVSSCKDQGASGAVMVRLTIAKNGQVSNASPQGGGAGGDCVASKVK